MASLTANQSNLSPLKSNLRLNFKHNRNYQKVSESNLDQSSIVSYLRSHDYNKTLSIFISQINYNNHVNPIITMLMQGGQQYQGTIQEYINLIKNGIFNQGVQMNDQDRKRWIRLEFYLNIWYCMDRNTMNASRLPLLKEYIKRNGDILAEVHQLLPYFALQYIEPMNHSTLKKIFTKQFIDEIKFDLQYFLNVQKATMEEEWLNIIKDMIEINDELISHIKINENLQLKNMIQRVNLYKSVIEKNNSKHNEVIKDHIDQIHKIQQIQCNFENIKKVKERLEGYWQQWQRTKGSSPKINILTLYNQLQIQIITKKSHNSDQEYIKQLIQNDILMLATERGLPDEYQWLKLLQILSSYYQCRTYLSKNKYIIKSIIVIISKYFPIFGEDYPLKIIYVGLDILQKLMIRQNLFDEISKHKQIIEIVVSLLNYYHQNYRIRQKDERMFEVILVWITNMVLHRKGRQKMSKTCTFELLVRVLRKMQNSNDILTIQSLTCGIVFLMLVEKKIRQQAGRMNLKEILLNRMLQKNNQSYVSIVQYILQRIEVEDQISQIESDVDEQKELQFDENIQVEQAYVYFQEKAIAKSLPKELMKKESNQIISHKQLSSKQISKQYNSGQYNRKNKSKK